MLNFYDFECYPKLWTVTIINPITKEETQIVNDVEALRTYYNSHKNQIYLGFNSRQYDDWIFKALLCGFSAWDMNNWLINKKRKGFEFSRLLSNIQLNSFDCMIGFNGLKTLEGFMGMDIRETEIPFDYDGEFTPEMIKQVLKYNRHDVMATIEVFMKRKSEFESYLGLIKMFNLPMTYLSKSKAHLSAIILGAKRTHHDDELDVSLPPTLKIEKYFNVLDFFKNKWQPDINYETEISGIPHTYGTGGIHGAIPNYFGEGDFLHIDVNSYYPSLMIRYPEYCMSRTGVSLERFIEIRDNRILFKKAGDARANALKIVLNSTFGAMKDKFNPLYDPRSNNNVVIFGQLLLTDLIERLEGHCDLIQSNTDGLIVKLHNNEAEVRSICKEWEERTGMGLGYDRVKKICQKDVNNYLMLMEKGGKWVVEAKGAYVKDLDDLDYDLPIVNDALRNYMLFGTPVEVTINSCTDFRKFQKIVKLSSKYQWVEHEQGYNPWYGKKGKLNVRYDSSIKYDNKAYRVFASLDENDGRLMKCKWVNGVAKKDKFGNTPEHCFIYNGDLTGMEIPTKLDRNYYINTAKERLKDFGL